MKNWWRNRDVIMILALLLGLLAGKGAHWTQPMVLPALAVIMTLSTTEVKNDIFRSGRELWLPSLYALFLNYLLLGTVLLGLSFLLVQEPDIHAGFVLLVAMPPAIAVIPFTDFLKGNTSFSLIGTMACYLGALIITPVISWGLLGAGFFNPVTLIMVILELILLPLIVSRILLWTSLADRLQPIKGAITNWGFFIVTYTIVGLNQDLILHQPLTLAPVAAIAMISTFLLGWLIERLGRLWGIDPPTIISLVLLGTLKNYGIAGGLALTLLSQKTAIPATVSTVFMVVYIIWLGCQKLWRHEE
jgi:bile acid:Na+ symporter, BASS family